MYSEYDTGKGLVKIYDTVLAKIVTDAVMSSYGVVGLTYRSAVDGLNTILHKDKMFKGVIINKTAEGIIINLDVVLKYGVNILTIRDNLVDTIKYKTEAHTGIRVYQVNINVQGIRV